MEIIFRNPDLDELETNPNFTAGYGKEIDKAYRKRIWAIRAATDERDLRAIRGNRFEKLQGARAHQYSLRLNEKMRLIVEIEPATPKNKIIVVEIEDYH
jgi:proteic killer suppression protein